MSILIHILIYLRLNKLIKYIQFVTIRLNVIYLSRKYKTKINFVAQGEGGLHIEGNINRFKIDETSHLKSNTFINCDGGVYIGKYFHTGRNLTIFSTNHNYNSSESIPYDDTVIEKEVIIEDYVWCGANVTIVPGVKIGEGAIIGSGALVSKEVPKYAIVGGNPAVILKYRDIDLFKKLRSEKRYY